MRVLITRPAGTWPALAARFEGVGVALQMSETTVAVDPIDPRPGSEAIDRLERYDWLVATSGRGVAALARRLAARGTTGLPAGIRVAAIGRATADALSTIGIPVDLVAASAGSDALAASLAPLIAGTRVVVVRPEGEPGSLAAVLRSAGATVDEASLYRTIASERAGKLADAAIAGAFDAVVLTAPSSLLLWLDAAGSRREALHDALLRAARVAIGPTTAEQMRAAGLPADAIADAPSEAPVGDAIARVLRMDLLR